MSPPRIVCVGANAESEEALRGLLRANASIVAVVTTPASGDQPCDYADLRTVCQPATIPVIETANINSSATVAEIAAFRPDYIYTLGWSRLFRQRLLEVPSQYCVGSHPAELPMGRGRAPLPWTILQDLRRSAVSLFKMTPGVDDGPLLLQRSFGVPEGVNAESLYHLVSENLSAAFVDLHAMHASGEPIDEVPQRGLPNSYRAKRVPADGLLDFSRPAHELERLVRAVGAPYPGAYSYLNGEKVVVWRASIENIPRAVGVAGQILLAEQNRVLVQAGDGPIWLEDLQPGQAECSLSKALRVGACFGYRVQDEIHDLRRQLVECRRQLESLLPQSTRRAG